MLAFTTLPALSDYYKHAGARMAARVFGHTVAIGDI
jgi:hypothetical protein